MNIKIIKYFSEIILLLILSISLYLGLTYSKFHTDPWHWGTTASAALDYINGFKMFKEIDIQYGPGMPILFSFINNFYKIDYYSIGVITNVIYSLNLIFVFLVIKKIANKFTAITITLLVFSLTHYPQIPWADFYAGLCITLSIFFLTLYKKKIIPIIVASFFLTLAIIFRNTYLINILISIFIYLLLTKLKNISVSDHIKKYFYFFFLFTLIFFFFLFINNDLKSWYDQGIGKANLLFNNTYKGYDISYVYAVLKLIYHLFIPNKIVNIYFSIFFIINLFFLFSILVAKENLKLKNLENKNIILYSILGLSGLIQSLNEYEVFRNSMACISIFFVVSYFIQKINKKKIFILIHLILLIIIFPIFPKNNYYQVNIYPTLGYVDLKNQFISNKELFRKTNIKFFGQHQFNEETIEYYNDIRSVICTYDKIINYSIDRTLVYICDKKNNIISTVNWYPIFFNDSQLDRKYKNESIQENEIVIADYNFSNPNLKLIKKINLPKYTRFTKADVFRQQFDDQLFFYIKKK
jgi:hypothetical protein